MNAYRSQHTPTGRLHKTSDVYNPPYRYQVKQKALGHSQLTLSDFIVQTVVNVSRCPACALPIEKLYGCNSVRCICGQVFCWVCGQKAPCYANCCRLPFRSRRTHSVVIVEDVVLVPSGRQSRMYCAAVEARVRRQAVGRRLAPRDKLARVLAAHAGWKSNGQSDLQVDRQFGLTNARLTMELVTRAGYLVEYVYAYLDASYNRRDERRVLPLAMARQIGALVDLMAREIRDLCSRVQPFRGPKLRAVGCERLLTTGQELRRRCQLLCSFVEFHRQCS